MLVYFVIARHPQVCEPWCSEPCSELLGDVWNECGGCGASSRCRPGASGFDAPVPTPIRQAPVAQAEPESGVTDQIESVFGSPQMRSIAQSIASVPPGSCGNGARWMIGPVHEGLRRVRICCRTQGSPTFLQLEDGSGWFADDTAAVGDVLRRRAAQHCDSIEGGQVTSTLGCVDEELGGWSCSMGEHMYSDVAGSGVANIARDNACIMKRHAATYGPNGLPQGVREADHQGVREALAGHKEPIGRQGQRRRAVDEVGGCDEAAIMVHLSRGEPLVLRGCVNASSPNVLEHWSAEYLAVVAGNHSTAQCPQRFGDYLAAFASERPPSYRNCAQLPPELLADVAVPAPLRRPPYRAGFDKAVLWYGRANVSPLHFDLNHNFLHQVDGEKRVLLLDPAESALLYADHTAAAVGNSPVDPLSVDLRVHPLVASATLWPAVLRPGDMLFLPSEWWHLVVTLPSAIAISGGRARNMALGVQFDPIESYTNAGFSLLRSERFLNRDREADWKLTVMTNGVGGTPASADEPLSMAELKKTERYS